MKKGIVIVTGGSSGLGLELIKKIAKLKRGYFICNIAQSKDKLTRVDKLFKNNYKSYCGDISDESFVKSTIEDVSKLGEIKCVINNAGRSRFVLPADNTSEIIDTCLDGLRGMMLVTGYALKFMTEGKIVNIMSSAALRGNKQESAYCACKWGERGFTESLKVAYKGTPIKIVGVYPGGIDTDFYLNNRDYVSEEKQHTFMSPEEVAQVIIDNVFNDTRLNVADIVIERL